MIKITMEERRNPQNQETSLAYTCEGADGSSWGNEGKVTYCTHYGTEKCDFSCEYGKARNRSEEYLRKLDGERAFILGL